MKNKFYIFGLIIFIISSCSFSDKKEIKINDNNIINVISEEKKVENINWTNEVIENEDIVVKNNNEKELLKEIINDDEENFDNNEKNSDDDIINKTIEELTQDFDEDEELDIESILNIKYE